MHTRTHAHMISHSHTLGSEPSHVIDSINLLCTEFNLNLYLQGEDGADLALASLDPLLLKPVADWGGGEHRVGREDFPQLGGP